MEPAYRLVQIAGQLRPRLRAHHLARQSGHHPPYLPGRNAAQKGFADEHRDLFRPPLKALQPARQKTLLPGTRDAQPDGAEAGHEIALVVAVTIDAAAATPPCVAPGARKAVALPLRLQFEKLLPRQLGLAIQIAPKRLLHLCQEMLEVLADRCYLRHRV
jgi:hypothetical protein